MMLSGHGGGRARCAAIVWRRRIIKSVSTVRAAVLFGRLGQRSTVMTERFPVAMLIIFHLSYLFPSNGCAKALPLPHFAPSSPLSTFPLAPLPL
jgi:hypothetical protein